MPESNISDAQLTRLQVLWSQYVRREMIKNSRDERLRWASEQTKRAISSFKELTLSEASDLINLLQTEMGIKESSPAVRPRRFRSRIKDRDQAQAAGTEGRRGSRGKFTIAKAEDLAMLDTMLTEMGWTRERLDAFLLSPSSPLRGRQQLRTVGDVNRVLWALKRIAERRAREAVQK
ncbi:MAG TPA: hypothetical protein VGP89_15045 [Candidatus Angelobacter sp.]|nr:hypothetical protein [Candidatus Angelobacter sp.]